MKLNKFNAKSIVVNVLNSDTRINKCNVYVGSHPSENYPIIAGSFLHNDKELYFYTYFDNIEFNTIVVKGLMDRIIKIYNSFCDNDIVFHEDRLFEICFA